MKKMCMLALCAVSLLLLFPAAAASEKKAVLRVVSWNVQTFFDGVTDGTEYAQFKGSASRWNEKKYRIRLERLSAALKALDADVVVLQELEKKEQLYDIFNQLSGTFRISSLYRYGCFAASPGSAIGVGVLSRFPLESASVHALDIGTERQMQPSLRPMLEVQVLRNGRKLSLFVCHWKSKLGSETQVWRKWQERLLSDCMVKASASGIACLACGDCNQDIAEFASAGSGTIALRGRQTLTVSSPWLTSSDKGSYCYKGAWERIDHFFSCGSAEVSSFCVERGGEWADSNGCPVRYDLKTGGGWSDHLPVSCTVRF